jgi:hypothetical protein
LKLFIILYADDTVILSESESDLQAQLDAFHEYCLTWKLKVNIDKTAKQYQRRSLNQRMRSTFFSFNILEFQKKIVR